MSYVNGQNLFSLLILVSLLHRIRSDWEYVSEQREIASRPRLENNFTETIGETAITTGISVNDEKFDDNELKKLFVRNFKLYENFVKPKKKTEEPLTSKPRRITRDVGNTTSSYGIECFSCHGLKTSNADLNCFAGVSIPSKICSDAEHCYIELNPLYIKRGCILPGRLNRTFICKCPLCNDKPSFDVSHYEYKVISDWEYDNVRLQTPLVGMDLMCKVCETKGTNPTSDKNCRFGKNADYMVCAHNQLCYTNIDDETDFVSRGCVDSPLYNSIYYFCNNTNCNNANFQNPRRRFSFHAKELMLKDDTVVKPKHAVMSSSSKIFTTDFFLVLILTLFKIKFI